MEWTAYVKAVTTSAWPKRLKSCISLHLESLTRNHTLRLRGRTYRQLTTSPTYQGNTLSRVVHVDVKVNNSIVKASVAFGRLRENVCERIAISISTKLKVYRAVLLITLLYSCETWTVYSRHVHANQLNHIHLSCLRRLLHIRWQDKNPDTEVIERAGIPSVDTHLQRAQVRWAGHVARMPGCRLPEQVLYGELCHGKWHFGAEETFQRLRKRRPRSLSSKWLSSTLEGQTTTTTKTTTASTMAREQ